MNSKSKQIMKGILFLSLFILGYNHSAVYPQSDKTFQNEIKSAIVKSTKYFDEKVSVNGGYVWYHSQDLSRRWGEMEAYPSMIWVQGMGTVAMGNTFLNVYEATKDEYFYKLAIKSAQALIKGQLECGGWNYMIDFAGEASINKWYDTIGKNGWRLEEFQHYYGNATFDDAVTTGAASFLLRVYLIDKNPEIKNALDKAVNFILESQYPLGGWPQRFPQTDEFKKSGSPDYTSYFTFNDNVIWNNIKFLTACYCLFNDDKFLDPIKRGMNFYILTQQSNPQAGWAMQYSKDLKPINARTYEPTALDPIYTLRHIEILIKFFEMTGDKKYLARIPDSFDWIESLKISPSTDDNYRLPKFVEIGTNKNLFVHRVGTNVNCGKYFADYDSANCMLHYSSIRSINVTKVKDEYEKIKSLTLNNISKDSFFIPISDSVNANVFKSINEFFTLPSERPDDFRKPDSNFIDKILTNLDSEGRWLTTRVYISNPYIGEPTCGDANTIKFAHTNVGDEYDTSSYENTTDQKYISTGTYIRNVNILMRFLTSKK